MTIHLDTFRFKRHDLRSVIVWQDRMGHLAIARTDGGPSVYLQGDDAHEARRQLDCIEYAAGSDERLEARLVTTWALDYLMG